RQPIGDRRAGDARAHDQVVRRDRRRCGRAHGACPAKWLTGAFMCRESMDKFADTQINSNAIPDNSKVATAAIRVKRMNPLEGDIVKPARHITPEVESHTLDPVTLGGRLRAARRAFGWTLAQLA